MSVEDYRQGLFESKQETLREFKDAWEEFQGEFYKAADLDPAHGGCYLITADRWRAVSRIVNAVIGKGQHVTVDALVSEAESTPEGKALMDEARAELKPKLDALHAATHADAARYRWLRSQDDWLQFQGYLENDPPERLDAYIDKLRDESSTLHGSKETK